MKTIERLAFYNLQSRESLARLLQISSFQRLNQLINMDEGKRYSVWENDLNGAKRVIEEPKKQLRLVHKRIANLLSRFELPPYVTCARKGHSYVTNAQTHIGGTQRAKLDIKKYYPSIKSSHIYSFFKHQLKCSSDVSSVMAQLCTFQGHIPTGSPLSPILSVCANMTLFNKISVFCEARDLTLTCYFDDITVSGATVLRKDLEAIRALIISHGLKVHTRKFKHGAPGEPLKVTGAIVVTGEARLPNARHQAIVDGLLAFKKGILNEKQIKSLHGRISEANQLAPKQARLFKKRFDTLSHLTPASSSHRVV